MTGKTNSGRGGTKAQAPAKGDLRQGMHGSLAVPETKLVGGDPLYSLDDPKLATPDFETPPGQTTHE